MLDRKPSILAIDDTPVNLHLLGGALAPDYDLQIATSGAMGLALARESPPDLILLDVMMPDADGYEICRQLKADAHLQEIPVIFLTIRTDFEAEIAGLKLGAADYIHKPVNVEIARMRIRNLLERERMRREIIVHRSRLEMALRGSRQVLFDWDIPNGTIVTDHHVNEICGSAPEELATLEAWLCRMDPRDRVRVEHDLNKHLDGDSELFVVEFRFRHKGGHWISIEARAKVTRRDATGAPLRMVGTVADITQSKRLRDEGVDMLKQVEALIREISSTSPDKEKSNDDLENLTQRERQMLGMIATGMTSAQIAQLLHIATSTVNSHRQNMMAKLDLHSVAEVTRFAIEHGLIRKK